MLICKSSILVHIREECTAFSKERKSRVAATVRTRKTFVGAPVHVFCETNAIDNNANRNVRVSSGRFFLSLASSHCGLYYIRHFSLWLLCVTYKRV